MRDEGTEGEQQQMGDGAQHEAVGVDDVGGCNQQGPWELWNERKDTYEQTGTVGVAGSENQAAHSGEALQSGWRGVDWVDHERQVAQQRAGGRQVVAVCAE